MNNQIPPQEKISMKTQIVSATLLALLMACAAHDTSGTSLKSLKPLAGIDAVSVNVMVGGPLGLRGGVELALFQGDIQRATRFEDALKKEVARVLHAYGVDLLPASTAEILISLYGRPTEKPDADHYYLYLLRVSLPVRDGTDTGIDEGLIPRTVIDVTREEELEKTLLQSIASILEISLEEAGKKRTQLH